MKKPTITEIKQLIVGLKGYRTYFGVAPQAVLCARLDDLRVEFDTGRKGVNFWSGAYHGPNRDRLRLHFRLAENWYESVYAMKLLWYRKQFVLSAEKCRPPGGMDAAWKLLVADQTAHRNFCRPVIVYAVQFMDKIQLGYPMRSVANRLREPYIKALGLETQDL